MYNIGDESDDRESTVSSFLEALKNVLEDDSFKTASPVAAKARKVAVGLLEWSAISQQFGALVKRLFTALKTPLISFSRRSCNREILWRDYFLLRSSKEFISTWVTFLTDANLTPTPIFYQHMTDVVFRGLISNHLIGFTEDSTPTPAVADHEGGALRYAAAYVCRHLRQKIEHGNHKFKEELVLVLDGTSKE